MTVENRNKKFISEDQVEEIVFNLLRKLSYDDNDEIKKHVLDKKVRILKDRVDKLDVETYRSVEIVDFKQKLYIPIDPNDVEPYEIRFTFTTDENTSGSEVLPAITHTFGILLMHDFANDLLLNPICNFINPSIRNILTSLNVNVVKNGVDTFIELDFNINMDSLRIIKAFADITNVNGHVELDTVTLDEGYTILKSTSVNLFPVTGFDDVPDKDKLVRSTSVKYYEVLSEEAYNALETESGLNDDTVYSIPEEGGVNG